MDPHSPFAFSSNMCSFPSSYRLNVFQYFSVSRLDPAEETPVPPSAFHHIPQLSFSTTSPLVPISAKFVCFMLPPRRNYLYPIGLATPCVCLFAFLLLSFQLLLLLYFDLHPPRYRCLTRQSLVAPFSFLFHFPPLSFSTSFMMTYPLTYHLKVARQDVACLVFSKAQPTV